MVTRCYDFGRHTLVGKYLSSHSITTIEADGFLDCAVQCGAHPQCLSFNYDENGDEGFHLCHLTNSVESNHPSDVVDRAGYRYTESHPCVQ